MPHVSLPFFSQLIAFGLSNKTTPIPIHTKSFQPITALNDTVHFGSTKADSNQWITQPFTIDNSSHFFRVLKGFKAYSPAAARSFEEMTSRSGQKIGWCVV